MSNYLTHLQDWMKTPPIRIRQIFGQLQRRESVPIPPDCWQCARNQVLAGGTPQGRLSIKLIGDQLITGIVRLGVAHASR